MTTVAVEAAGTAAAQPNILQSRKKKKEEESPTCIDLLVTCLID
jgi:hypothetical protein